MKHSYSILFAGLVGAAILLSGCVTTTKTTNDVSQVGDSNPAAAGPVFVDYAPPNAGFHTKYDGVWHPEPGYSTLSLRYIYSDMGALSEMGIDIPSMPSIAAHFPGMITLDRVQNGYVDDLKKRMDQVQVARTDDQMLDGVKGRRVKITAQENHESKLIDVIFAIKGSQVYIISTDCVVDGIKTSSHAMNTVINNWKWNG
jgi:hypothetical protein